MPLDGGVLISYKPGSALCVPSPPKQLIFISGVIRNSAIMRYDFPARHTSLQIALINTSTLSKLPILSFLPALLCASLSEEHRERKREGLAHCVM